MGVMYTYIYIDIYIKKCTGLGLTPDQNWHQLKYQQATHKQAVLFLVCLSAAEWWETCKL